ncbi:uncharacterized protein [Nicotiana tomentosiformis]|uniref:uncharacterized protein n=1 Tax=Nicotiana tomentosiformis TaxID=4098 RepID=UPI00051AB4E2|nr:uncharacterized protein LOC117280098 [Nicotiana tomentosiformis]
MYATKAESLELVSYRLQDLAAGWYRTWELSKETHAPPTSWREFSEAFLKHYMLVETKRARVNNFLNLHQGSMSAKEYDLQFNSLARYTPTIVANMEDRVHRYVVGLGPHLINEYMTVELQPGMDIARMQAYAENLEVRKEQQQDEQEWNGSQCKRTRFSGSFCEPSDSNRQPEFKQLANNMSP